MKEEELLRKRLIELANKAFTQNIYTYTHFLNEYEQSIYQEMQKELSFADSHLEGGHEYFTRAAAVFGSEEMFGYQGEIPLACARISPVFDKYAEKLSHRDYLGAMMHLGIDVISWVIFCWMRRVLMYFVLPISVNYWKSSC